MRSTTFTHLIPPNSHRGHCRRPPAGATTWCAPSLQHPTPPRRRCSAPPGCAARSAATSSPGHLAVDRDGKPPGHRPAGRRTAARTRRPGRLRGDRPSPGARRGQPRAVPDAGHPHRCAHHQHRGHRPVRPHPRRRRDPDAAHPARARRWPRWPTAPGATCGRWHRRRPLWVGVAIGGAVDGATGHVDHPRLGWRQAPVGPVLAEALGLPVSVASHVDAMAGAELLLGMRRFAPSSSTSLYVYARETVGYALVIDGRVHSPASGPGTIANLPAQSELLGGSGLLESTVSDEAVLAAARRLRHPAGPATAPRTDWSTELLRGRPRRQRAGPGAARRAGPGARRGGGAAARPAQPRRPGGRRAGVHRVPRGHGAGRGRVRRSARCCRRATSGSPPSATGCRRPAPGSCRWPGCTPTRWARCAGPRRRCPRYEVDAETPA